MTLEHDTYAPRDEANRYHLFAVIGDERKLLATAASGPAIGLALVTLHEDAKAIGRRLVDEGRIGVLDVMPGGKPGRRGEWIVQPYDRRPA